MKNIKFTIITVTYNAGSTLERTLRSVAKQTYPHIEHIIIDGASKDNTLEIAHTHGKHLAKIVSEPDKGLYDAMNKGLLLATGDYVCFLNAGDKLHSTDTLEKMNENIQKSCDTSSSTNLPGVLYGQTNIVDNDEQFIAPRRLSPHDGLTWKSFKQGMLVCHQAFYARRDLCPKYNTAFRFSADFDWCIRVMKQTDNLLHLPFPVADYLQEGMTTQNHRTSLIERFRLMCHHYGIFTTIVQHLWFVIRAVIHK
ncbi:MAG: glycosyltransferase [Bacteroidaceae bacterium]|nr:glycosyltransferase [Bacteroidaceae bacterium]